MRLVILILFLFLSPIFAWAQGTQNTDPINVRGVQDKIAQKIRMVNMILNSPDLQQRIEASEDSLVRDLHERAVENFYTGTEYFEGGKYLEAEAVLDYVLRDLSASSRLLGLPRLKRNEFQKFMEQLDSFVLPEWSDLTDEENDLLQAEMANVSDLRSRAVRMADNENYNDAISLLEEAYLIKASLLERLRHETTIVYDLNFDTVQDEYRYLINRTYHYLDLVQTALAQTEVDAQTRKLTDRYLYDSMLNLEVAEDFESHGQFSEAIPVLDKAITRLLAVLKILGITI